MYSAVEFKQELLVTRHLFLSELRQGLWNMAEHQIDDILANYDAHFTEALALGRSEQDVAVALGDPAGLVREFSSHAPYRFDSSEQTLSWRKT